MCAGGKDSRQFMPLPLCFVTQSWSTKEGVSFFLHSVWVEFFSKDSC